MTWRDPSSTGEDVIASAAPGAVEDEPTRPGLRGRIAGAFSGSRQLIQLIRRDPEHIAERLTLYAADHLGEPSRQWAEDIRSSAPDMPAAVLAEELRIRTAKIARVDGAVAGTPFLLALVPAYVSYLWQEARMGLRVAALYDHDPRELRTAAEALALRGVHPSVEVAEAELLAVRARPLPPPPEHRLPLRTWIRSGRQLLVFGGFISPSSGPRPEGFVARLQVVGGLVAFAAMWIITCIFPLTFMVAMAWGCESHARTLGSRTLELYDGDAATAQAAIAASRKRRDEGHGLRQALRGLLLGLSVILPIAFVAFANHVRNTTGVNWLASLGALVALALVLAIGVASRR